MIALIDTHTEFTLLGALPKVKKLVTHAKASGYSAIGIADGPGMYGALQFYQVCKKEEIKPVIGVTTAVRVEKLFLNCIFIAKTSIGYRQLMRLSSTALTRESDEDPYVRVEEIQDTSDICVVVTHASVSETYAHQPEHAVSGFKQIAKHCPLGAYTGLDPRIGDMDTVIEFSKKTGTPLIAAPAVYYLEEEHKDAYRAVQAIATKSRVHELPELAHSRAFMSPEDFNTTYKPYPEAIASLESLTEAINIDIPVNAWEFPRWNPPEGITADDELRRDAYAGAETKFETVTDEMKERLDYELGIIKTKGYSTYFLIVADILNWARDKNIATTTRGSAAGSFVSYCTGINSVDPIKYHIPFERFLNPYRPSLPDIDMDFADYRRNEIIEYVKQRYGKERVAQIGTFGTMQARAVVRDIGRVLGYGYGFCDGIAKLIPMGKQGFPMTLERALEESPELAQEYETNPDVERLIAFAKAIEGNARHTSVHAAGTVIAPDSILRFTPLHRDPDTGQIITQYNMRDVEAGGLVKMDFLGITNLTIIEKTVALVKRRHRIDIDIDTIPLEDSKTFELLTNGYTNGLFQLNGDGMTKYLKDLRPERIEDIMIMVALYRPGPIDSIPEYISRKNGKTEPEPPHEKLRGILENTYGLLVYQDDVILTAIELAGYNWGEADKFRKAMGKKIPEVMAEQKTKFYEGCKTHSGLKETEIDEIWSLIEPFAAYGFGRAHAASYGMVAYQTAYLKANYPAEYMTSVLNADIDNQEKLHVAVAECSRLGIDVLPPCVNTSDESYTIETAPESEKHTIRTGLSAIKNVGSNAVADIVKTRLETYPVRYESITNILTSTTGRDVNKKSLESLIMAGAFSTPDANFGEPHVLLGNLDRILSWLKQYRDRKKQGLVGLFAETEDGEERFDIDESVEIPDEPTRAKERCAWEKSLLGYYIQTHPLEQYVSSFPPQRIRITDVLAKRNEDRCIIGVKPVSYRLLKTKKRQEDMMAVQAMDETGDIELVVFPITYEAQGSMWLQAAKDDSAVLAEISIAERGEEKSYIVQKTKIISVAAENGNMRTNEPVATIAIPDTLTPDALHAIKKICRAHPGALRVTLAFEQIGRIIQTQERISVTPELRRDIARICNAEIRISH